MSMNIVLSIKKIDEFFLLKLDNNDNILISGSKIYNILYDKVLNVFNMDNKSFAVTEANYKYHIVSLENMEEVLTIEGAYSISKIDEESLLILMNNGSSFVYNIKNKRCIENRIGYQFEQALSSGLYVYRENYDENTEFYDYKRYIVNEEGNIVLDDIRGWIIKVDDYLLIKKENELLINKVKDNNLGENGKIISNAIFYEKNIIKFSKHSIKFYTLSLELIDELKLSDASNINHYEIIDYFLKLNISSDYGESQIVINLKNKKVLSHINIEGYPYWTPHVFIGKDTDDSRGYYNYGETYELTEYYFYDSELKKLFSIKGNYCMEVGPNDGNIFTVGIWNGKFIERKFINVNTKTIKDSPYDKVFFRDGEHFGISFISSTNIMNIVDENLNTISSNIDCKKLNISKNDEFGYNVLNGYIIIYIHIYDYSRTSYRNVIIDPNGKVILDSLDCKCIVIDNLIEIIENNQVKFLDTNIGEYRKLVLYDNGVLDYLDSNLLGKKKTLKGE